MKKRVRMAIDIIMVILMLLLMAYSLVGEELHEIAGVAMFVCFAIHQILNRGWYKALFKGRYTPQRIIRTVINILLLVVIILQPISGIMMSKHLFTFIQVRGISAISREVHLMLAYWAFVLMSMHAGTHIRQPKGRAGTIISIIAAAVSIYGIYAFIKRGFPGYMFGTMKFAFFDFSEPRVFFFLDYIAIMILFATVGAALIYLTSRKKGAYKCRQSRIT
ncbi:MAG: cytochrome b/b6 domain-containing protein [Lachnospiraceae bacterium]|nr:cytochrome b/b6 domain-containing protein [Lachnospiraceae bacterium]